MVEVSGEIDTEVRSGQNNIVGGFIHDFQNYSKLADSKFSATNSYLIQLLNALLKDHPEMFLVNPKFGKYKQNRAFKTNPLPGFIDFIVEGIKKEDTPSLKISESTELAAKVGFRFVTVLGGGDIKGSNRNNIPGTIFNDEQIKAFNEFLSKASLPVD